ncbi:MAG: hypothetical protein ACRAVC_15635 [Trichormus sp.]
MSNIAFPSLLRYKSLRTSALYSARRQSLQVGTAAQRAASPLRFKILSVPHLTGSRYKAKSGVDFPPALLPLCEAAQVFERSHETYNVTHQPSIVTLA